MCLYWKVRAIKVYGGVQIQLHSFLTSALGGGEGSGSHPGICGIGGWVGSRANLDILEKRKLIYPDMDQTLGHSASSIFTTDCIVLSWYWSG